MTDILPKYKDPKAADKLSAHIFVERGIAEAITNLDGRTDTWITAHSLDPTGITVIGNNGSTSFNIVFKPGAQFSILNSMPDSPTIPPHFLAYYLMGTGSANCTATPTTESACAPRSTECVVAKASTTTRRKPTAPAKGKRRVPKPKGHQVLTTEETNADCSNSHWP